jgi:D-amino-acid dehydrogenase
MHVMVLGAGIAGVSTAWYLHQAGYEVSVVDRQPEAGRETSFANGGQISISHPEPWSNPATPFLALRWLGKPDAPLTFHPRASSEQWMWALRFLHECLPWRSRRNTEAIASLATFSGERLRALRTETGISYDQRERGILHLFFTPEEFRHAAGRATLLSRFGIDARVCDADECMAIEPALAAQRGQLVGGLYAPGDESGDAFRFTQALAERLRQKGVRFHYNTRISALSGSGSRINGVEVLDAAGRSGMLAANAFVVCLGSFSPRMVAPLGEQLIIYPVKGYSVTAPVLDGSKAPEVSLTDESRRIVCSRLGDRLRIAGTAELGGFDTDLRPERVRTILDWVQTRFPGAIDPAKATPWAGLRPATPGNLPIIGKGHSDNLWFNTGHGTLGWTLACGSAASLAELMLGRRPAPQFPFRAAA